MTDLELFLSCLCVVLALANYMLWRKYLELSHAAFVLAQGIKSVASGKATVTVVDGDIKLKEL